MPKQHPETQDEPAKKTLKFFHGRNCSEISVINTPTCPKTPSVADTLSLLTPQRAVGYEKIRVGAEADGGYVMLDDFNKPFTCYSLGIEREVSWDLDMAARGATVFQYDFSVSGPPVDHCNFRFSPIRIAAVDDIEQNIARLDSLVLGNTKLNSGALILKMDIEDAEWSVFDSLETSFISLFDQIVVEFHYLNRLSDPEWHARIHSVLSKLHKTHMPIHIHGNNFDGLVFISHLSFPRVMEVSFASRKKYAFTENEENFPTELDRPNVTGAQDFLLGKFNFSGSSAVAVDSSEIEWVLEGIFTGSSGIAQANRSLAIAMEQKFPNQVRIIQTDGALDKDAYATRDGIVQLAKRQLTGRYRILIYQHWVLRAPSVPADICLAMVWWETTRLFERDVVVLNNNYDAVLAPSSFVRDALENSDVKLPLFNVGYGYDLKKFASIERLSSNYCDGAYTFLHVSDCHPRKGVDILIKAFQGTFGRHDNVKLIIKGANNSNTQNFAEQIGNYSSSQKNIPKIQVITEILDEEALIELYRSSDCVVLPTRGEGLGLPAAEALAAGNYLIITGCGGQMDFVGEGNARLLNFKLLPATGYFSTPGAMWAEPDLDDLSAALREAVRRKHPRQKNCDEVIELFKQSSWANRIFGAVSSLRSLIENQRTNIFETLSLLTPRRVVEHQKIRVGADKDGGYVMLDDFGDSPVCYSLAVSRDKISWDRAMCEAGAIVFHYNDTTETPPFLHPNLRFTNSLDKFFDITYEFETKLEYSDVEKNQLTSMRCLKIDLAGKEWEVLEKISSNQLSDFAQIIVTFHWLSRIKREKHRIYFASIFMKLWQTHVPAHVHGNNFSGLLDVEGYVIPDVLEVTYANRKIYTSELNSEVFPNEMDRPNWPGRPDYNLGLFDFAHCAHCAISRIDKFAENAFRDFRPLPAPFKKGEFSADYYINDYNLDDIPKTFMLNEENAPIILVAILAKQKEKSLPVFLECFEKILYPKKRIVLYVRTNNNKDSTVQILEKWLALNGADYLSVEYDAADVPEQVETFGIHEWNPLRFRVLSRIRDISLQKTIENNVDFYFTADVDVFIRPETLMALVALDVQIVAPFLRAILPGSFNSNFFSAVDDRGYFQDCPNYKKIVFRHIRGVLELPLVHMCYLIRRDVIKKLSYDDGSDRYEFVIFSESARNAGIPQFLDNRFIYGYITCDDDQNHTKASFGSEFHNQAEAARELIKQTQVNFTSLPEISVETSLETCSMLDYWDDRAKKAADRRNALLAFGQNAVGILTKTPFGMFVVDPEDSVVSAQLLHSGVYSQEEYELARSLTTTTSNILIVGAHIGCHAIRLAENCNSVTCIEANPHTFELLMANIDLNRRKNIVAFNCAAGESAGQINFVLNRENSGGSKREPKNSQKFYFYDNPEIITIKMCALDDLLIDKTFDLICMDIEGSEYFALLGMKKMLEATNSLSIEFLPHHIRDVAGVNIQDFADILGANFSYMYVPADRRVVEKNSLTKNLVDMYEANQSHEYIYFFKEMPAQWAR